MCYYTERRKTTASVVVPQPGLQPALQPADQTGQNPLQHLGKPTVLLYTNAMHIAAR